MNPKHYDELDEKARAEFAELVLEALEKLASEKKQAKPEHDHTQHTWGREPAEEES